jgi:NAD(P)-dependent dehydrogenase (short-subunit alcohol dehydrogenase family)
MLACSRDGEALVEELFRSDVLWVPYVDPGFILAKSLYAALEKYRKSEGREPLAILMQNHGLIVYDDSPDEVIRKTDAFVARVRRRVEGMMTSGPFGEVSRMEPGRAKRLVEIVAPALRGLLGTDEALAIVTLDDSETVMQLVSGTEGRETASGGAVTPDQIVYCKALALWFDCGSDDTLEALVPRLGKAVEDHASATRFAPKVVLVKGVGMFAAGEGFVSADTARAVYRDAIRVMAGARLLGGVQYLSERDREFIENWEVESYRRAVATAGQPKGRAQGKVAVVTGAAQGFGYEIAADLVGQGGHVALTDINSRGAKKAAETLDAGGRAIGLGVDVTEGASVAEALHHVVRRFGGFDVFVSNAGVLRAGSVKTQPEREFEMVTSVNYKGYFNCVQKAAGILAVQHAARPSYTSDIIQINSKSGLVGSNRNSAYAGSKFGGIGLTQSFALELIEDGIKVNAICPGNFFDGPLWSDPENGLFVQYLRSGKVPGAKTVEDVRRAYEARIPMGRGCTTGDVMKAIYYIIEQKYETGQAVPVTGGQVMLG